jgi:hypothetical protein
MVMIGHQTVGNDVSKIRMAVMLEFPQEEYPISTFEKYILSIYTRL